MFYLTPISQVDKSPRVGLRQNSIGLPPLNHRLNLSLPPRSRISQSSIVNRQSKIEMSLIRIVRGRIQVGLGWEKNEKHNRKFESAFKNRGKDKSAFRISFSTRIHHYLSRIST